MDMPDRYNGLKRKVCSPFQEIKVDPSSLDEFSQKLLDACHQNSYVLHSRFGENPRVVILGYSHKASKNNQEDGLVAILKKSMGLGDALAQEGGGPCEIIYKNHAGRDLVGKLKEFFLEKDIRVFLNEKQSLILSFMLASNRLNFIQKEYGESNKPLEYVRALEDYFQVLKARDDTMCHHESFGIIPLVQDTADIWNGLSPAAKIYQLVGLLHIHTGNISKNLQESGVSNLIFIPKEPYS